MYNRYMQKVQDVDDYIELEKKRPGPPPRPAPGPLPENMPPLPPFYGHQPPPPPPPPKPPEDAQGGLGSIGSILGGLHIPKLELDDILLLAILFLVLREDGDEDLMLIIAALYLLGQN